jgi:rhodanese-related sulfurtransferase
VAFVNLVDDAKTRIQEISVDDLREKQQRHEPLVLIDVREDHEWSQGRIPGAVHLGRGILERDIESNVPDRSSEIVLYCGGGYRSALAADNLQKMGYRNVKSMAGGIGEWRRRGLPETR